MVLRPGWVRTKWFDKFVGVKRIKRKCQWHFIPLNGFARTANPGVLSEARMAET